MLSALALAIGDLRDRRILAILLQALAITVLIFVLLAAVLAWVFAGSDPCALVDDSCSIGAGVGGFGAFFVTLLAAWFLFPGVAIGVITGFADRICAAVEQRHYPAAAAEARPLGAGRAALMGLKSAGRILLFNLIALPFYILLLVTGIGPFVLFVIVNGLAFGRDLGELAASRHGSPDSRREWLRATRGEQGLMGTAVSVLFLVPFVNLVAPVIGTATAIHLYKPAIGAACGQAVTGTSSTGWARSRRKARSRRTSDAHSRISGLRMT